MNIVCPICNSQPEFIRKLDSEYIKDELSKHFNNKIDINVEIIDYSILKCNICCFEYAFPFVDGSSSFYNWVTSQSNYYPKSRWEYNKVYDHIVNNSEPNVIDIGCGDGKFLDFLRLKNKKKVECFGIDPTKSSVEECIRKEHKVFCMDIQEFIKNYPNKKFDAVTAFHVLEHIAKPKEFLVELLSLTSTKGSIYVSTPYSPMVFELEWFDVLNNPPHHMGRWNLKSYKKLAELLNLDIDFFMPDSQSLLSSAIQSFIFSTYGNTEQKSKNVIIKKIIINPIKFISHMIKQSKRDQFMGKRVSNVILVKFTKRQ